MMAHVWPCEHLPSDGFALLDNVVVGILLLVLLSSGESSVLWFVQGSVSVVSCISLMPTKHVKMCSRNWMKHGIRLSMAIPSTSRSSSTLMSCSADPFIIPLVVWPM